MHIPLPPQIHLSPLIFSDCHVSPISLSLSLPPPPSPPLIKSLSRFGINVLENVEIAFT